MSDGQRFLVVVVVRSRTHLVGVVVYIRHALTPEPASQPLRISDGAVGVVAMGTDHGWDGGGAQLELMHVHGGSLAEDTSTEPAGLSIDGFSYILEKGGGRQME